MGTAEAIRGRSAIADSFMGVPSSGPVARIQLARLFGSPRRFGERRQMRRPGQKFAPAN
jgi:hypothetical protein